MDEEMVTLHNVMPVDLAIKREMEYRQKMEILKNKRPNNLNPLLPSQVYQVSQPTLLSQPTLMSQPTLLNQPTLWSQATLVSQATLKRKDPSTSGIKPKKRRSTGFSCKICNLSFATVAQVKDHSNGLRHKNSASQLKKRGKNVSTPFLCELCNSACSSDIVLEYHLRGAKHVTTLQEFENSRRARG